MLGHIWLGRNYNLLFRAAIAPVTFRSSDSFSSSWVSTWDFSLILFLLNFGKLHTF